MAINKAGFEIGKHIEAADLLKHQAELRAKKRAEANKPKRKTKAVDNG